MFRAECKGAFIVGSLDSKKNEKPKNRFTKKVRWK